MTRKQSNGDGTAPARVEEQLGGLRAEAPKRAGTLNPGTAMGAFKSTCSAQGNGGIEGADGNANLRIGRGRAALGGSHIGAALGQLRGNADGDVGQGQIERRRRKRELRGGQIDERGDGMLVLRAGLVHIDELRTHRLKLGAGQGHVCLSGDAAAQTLLGQVELMLVVGKGGAEQPALRVETAEGEVILRQFCVQAQVDCGHVGRAGLGGGAGGLDAAAHAAPEVGLPGSLAGNLKIVVIPAGGGAGEGTIA